jgi:hypothetical protein
MALVSVKTKLVPVPATSGKDVQLLSVSEFLYSSPKTLPF